MNQGKIGPVFFSSDETARITISSWFLPQVCYQSHGFVDLQLEESFSNLGPEFLWAGLELLGEHSLAMPSKRDSSQSGDSPEALCSLAALSLYCKRVYKTTQAYAMSLVWSF